MSTFGKHGRRCDKCGKISKSSNTGEYARKDGTCGYIWPDGDTDDERSLSRTDTCDDCLEKAAAPQTKGN